MNLLDELKTLGADTDAGVKHFKGNVEFFERLVRKFPSSISSIEVKPFIEFGDIKQAYNNAHALKGICANLYITPLYDLYTKISATLKENKTDGVLELLDEAEQIKQKFITVIESN